MNLQERIEAAVRETFPHGNKRNYVNSENTDSVVIDGDFNLTDLIQRLTAIAQAAVEEERKLVREKVMRFGRDVMRLGIKAGKASGTHDRVKERIPYADVLKLQSELLTAVESEEK